MSGYGVQKRIDRVQIKYSGVVKRIDGVQIKYSRVVKRIDRVQIKYSRVVKRIDGVQIKYSGVVKRISGEVPKMNLKPETLNCWNVELLKRLRTQNPKLETPNSKLETRNPKPETQNPKLETFLQIQFLSEQLVSCLTCFYLMAVFKRQLLTLFLV